MSKAIDAVRLINPEGLYDPSANAYTHIAVVPAGQTFVYVSGQGGETAEGILVPDFRGQLKQAFANLTTALASPGISPQDVVKQTTLVADHNEEKLRILAEESQEIWSNRKCPVNTLIPVPRLALEGMLIEIDALAVL